MFLSLLQSMKLMSSLKQIRFAAMLSHIIYSASENLYIRCHRSLKKHILILNGILSVG